MYYEKLNNFKYVAWNLMMLNQFQFEFLAINFAHSGTRVKSTKISSFLVSNFGLEQTFLAHKRGKEKVDSSFILLKPRGLY